MFLKSTVKILDDPLGTQAKAEEEAKKTEELIAKARQPQPSEVAVRPQDEQPLNPLACKVQIHQPVQTVQTAQGVTAILSGQEPPGSCRVTTHAPSFGDNPHRPAMGACRMVVRDDPLGTANQPPAAALSPDEALKVPPAPPTERSPQKPAQLKPAAKKRAKKATAKKTTAKKATAKKATAKKATKKRAAKRR